MSLQTELNRAQPMLDGLNAAIRENPLAAGLIGAGIAWILMGGTKGISAVAGAAKGAAVMSGSAAAAAGASVASAGAKAGSGILRAATQVADGVNDVASRVSEEAGSIVPDVALSSSLDDAILTAQDIKAATANQWDGAVDKTRRYGSVLQSRLSESLDQQPMLLGAIGLMIGAGVASAFATTPIERDLMGEQGTAARTKLNDIAGQAKDLASNVVGDLKDEAAKQGFTADAVVKAAGEIADKVKKVRNSMPKTDRHPHSRSS